MAASLTFNSVDLSTYGLSCDYPKFSVAQEVSYEQLENHALKTGVTVPPLEITVDCEVNAATHSALITALDNIKATLNTGEEDALSFDIISGRYWNAIFKSMTPAEETAVRWAGTITFLALYPYAYSTTETAHIHTIDSSPDSVEETAGGTANVLPEIKLTADSDLGTATIEVNNEETGEILEWTGTLNTDDVLVIDCENYSVTLNDDVEDGMAGLDAASDFPCLIPGANTINISGFSGSCKFTYHARYF